MKYRYLGPIATLFFLSACHKSSQPIKNIKPKYEVTISGVISPKLIHPMYLAVWATYAAYNPSCKVDVNWLEGVKGLPSHVVFYRAVPEASGHYEIKVPIDAYHLGHCDWKIAWIDYAVMFSKIPKDKSQASYSTLMQFGRQQSMQENPAVPPDRVAKLYDCRSKVIDACQGHTFLGLSAVVVSRHKSYFFVQNLEP